MNCKKQLVELQNNLAKIEQAEIQIVGISYDDVPVLQSFAEANQIEFPLLSDHLSRTENKTIHAYQVFDPREQGKYRGVPVPTTIIVNQEQKIHAILPGEIKKSSRHSVDELIQAVSDGN